MDDSTRDSPVPFVRVHFEPDEALMAKLRALLASGKVTNGGPASARLEDAAARRLAVPSVAATSSGTMALLLALRAAGVQRGAAVVPAYTYAATLNAVVWAGLEPVLVDIEPQRLTLDAAALAETLGERDDVAVVVPVNVFGVPPDFAALHAVCAPHGIPLVYDAAHAFGTRDPAGAVPACVRAAAFSLHATKVWPAVEGGLVAAHDPAIVERVRRLANHGLPPPEGEHFEPGLNAKLDELRATIALHTLDRFDEALATRRKAWSAIRHCVARSGSGVMEVQRVPEGVVSNAQNLWVAVDPRAGADAEWLVERFAALGVEARRYFDPPLHHLDGPWARRCRVPAAEAAWAHSVCLPLHAHMPEDMLARVVRAVEEVCAWLHRRPSHSPS